MDVQRQITSHDNLLRFQQARRRLEAAEAREANARGIFFRCGERLNLLPSIPILTAADADAVATLVDSFHWIGLPIYPSNPNLFVNAPTPAQVNAFAAPHGLNISVGPATEAEANRQVVTHGLLQQFQTANQRGMLTGVGTALARAAYERAACQMLLMSEIPVVNPADVDAVARLRNEFQWSGIPIYPNNPIEYQNVIPLAQVRQSALTHQYQVFSAYE